ncbi:uncharacterized protein LOC123545710 [Mercenaria mercenaria]|uniref:uncharacterized protein LOC123545710 n=1 Tax=Mercenaria mercenaria TaxID=6596 RepID=UPI00234E8C48|nr:uncharacterized protein LOC123545710 [Mercenaria mercenaria]
MWTLILVFLSCLILPQNSSCIETESCLENVLKRLQDLENRVSVQDSVIEELRKTTATLRDSNAELRETNTELQETNAKLRATNDKLHAASFQLVETNKELRNAYLHLSEANAELREASRMNHKLTSLKAFKPAKRFVLNNEGPVAFTAAILPLVIDHLKTNDIVKFETVITDIGGGYNNQSGVFVAPVTGIYMFSCSLMEHYEMVSSGVMVNAEIVQSQRVLGRIFAAEPGSYHDQGAQTVFTHVNQGDQIWVRTIDNQNLGLGGELYSTFSGYLLLAM